MALPSRPSTAPVTTSSASRELQHVVIFGAGPIGLFISIMLKKRGVANVTVVDPRAGTYTRPGYLDSPARMLIAGLINEPLLSLGSSHQHIKDIERWLYDIAGRLGIIIRQDYFKSFVDNKTVETSQLGTGVTLFSSSANSTTLPCDLAIDATGPNRAVIKYLNSLYKEEPPFDIEPVAENPIKTHFIAYVSMDDTTLTLMRDLISAQKKGEDLAKQRQSDVEYSQFHTRALSELQEKFGWNEYDLPDIHIIEYGKNKICFYFETPPHLPSDQQENFMRSLLKTLTGSDVDFKHVKPSRKYITKPRFLPFTVDPHRVTPFIHMGDEKTPMVIPMGDTLLQSDHRLGTGIIWGTNRAMVFVNSIMIRNAGIVLDHERYTRELIPLIDDQISTVRSVYVGRWNKLNHAIENEKIYFKRSIDSSSSNTGTDEKTKMLRHYMEIEKTEQALTLYRHGLFQYGRLVNSKNEINLNVDAMYLDRSSEKIVNAINMLPSSRLSQRKKMENQLATMAVAYKQLGNKLHAMKKYDECEVIYLKALELYAKHLPNQYLHDVVILHSNLVISANKKENYDEAIKRADLVLEKMPEIKEKNKMIGKIGFNKLTAMIKKMQKEKLSEDMKTGLHTQAMDLLNKLKTNKTLLADDLKRMEDELSPFRPSVVPSRRLS